MDENGKMAVFEGKWRRFRAAVRKLTLLFVTEMAFLSEQMFQDIISQLCIFSSDQYARFYRSKVSILKI